MPGLPSPGPPAAVTCLGCHPGSPRFAHHNGLGPGQLVGDQTSPESEWVQRPKTGRVKADGMTRLCVACPFKARAIKSIITIEHSNIFGQIEQELFETRSHSWSRPHSSNAAHSSNCA